MTEYGKKHTDGSRSGGQEPYVIWTPRFDGDAPPNWVPGMKRWYRRPGGEACWHQINSSTYDNIWWRYYEYRVPPEALAAELPSCPCCEADAALIPHAMPVSFRFYVKCSNDGCGLATSTFRTEEEAVKVWSARANADKLPSGVAEALGPERYTLSEKQRLQVDAGIPHLPTDDTYEFRMAVTGEGPRAYDWSDKKHRLLYDACRIIEENAASNIGKEITDEWLRKAVTRIVFHYHGAAGTSAKAMETLRAIIVEAGR